VHFDITRGTVSYSTTLEPNGLVTALTANGYAVPGGDSCSLVIAVMVNPNLFSFRNIYSAIIAWLSHRLRIFSDFNIKVDFCPSFNNGFHLPFFIKIVFICCEKYKSQHIFITFYNIVLTVKTLLKIFDKCICSRFRVCI